MQSAAVSWKTRSSRSEKSRVNMRDCGGKAFKSTKDTTSTTSTTPTTPPPPSPTANRQRTAPNATRETNVGGGLSHGEGKGAEVVVKKIDRGGQVSVDLQQPKPPTRSSVQRA